MNEDLSIVTARSVRVESEQRYWRRAVGSDTKLWNGTARTVIVREKVDRRITYQK